MHFKSYFISFLIFLFSCSTNQSTPQIPEPEKVSESKDFGLQYKTAIRSIFQDSKGNFWFGSHQEGVCLYDGIDFTYFKIEDGLSDNQIRTIQEDEKGIIWFGTGKGICSYDGESIMHHTFYDQDPENSHGAISKNDLWFDAGHESAVYRYNGNSLTYFTLPIPENSDPLNSNAVTGFAKSATNKIWIITYAAVFEYDGQTFIIINENSIGYASKDKNLHIRSVFEDSKGNLWIGNNGIGVLLMQGEAIINFSELMHLRRANSPGDGSNSPKGTLEHVFAIAEDAEGNIWFGDRDTGAWKYDGSTIKNYTQEHGLTDPFVQSIYLDKNGNLLLGMGDGSVCQLKGDVFEKVY
ncbi:MAG: diguanylate cyclase [Crocinitomix sp.]|nr:diguanylate cyclase [Crocinitomix sp.]